MSSNIYPVQCTAGAIPYKNEKGEISMKNVKVSRHVAGKAPEYLNIDFEDDHDDDIQDAPELIKDAFPDRNLLTVKKNENAEIEEEMEDNEAMDERDTHDRRMQRLIKTHRRIDVEMLDDSDSDHEQDKVARHLRERQAEQQKEGDGSEEEEDNIEDEEVVRQRRYMLKMKALTNEIDDVPEYVEVDEEEEEEVAYSDQEETDSENEREPKMKPVFVKSSARHTKYKTKEQFQHEQDKERQQLKRQDELMKQTRKMIETINKEEANEGRVVDRACDAVNSDVENETEDYEMWKMRELMRIKRDRDEKEQERKSKDEVMRVRNMTEDQRLHEFKVNPKHIMNQQPKGKLKYMQKYYHRGAFFVQDKEDDVYKRDFNAPTLEDNFNVQNLPLIKQVKNFGRAGRTKYTHLVDQDTTDYESGWASNNSALKFFNTRGGGMKQVFEKPSATKKKK